MIEWVELINFQKWDHLKINFSKGINIFSGRSAIGKSAVIRALIWCMFNKTDHAEIRKYLVDSSGNIKRDKKGKILFTKETIVRIGVDGHVVERYLSSSLNAYKLDDETFTAFGRTVPSPIKSLFNISEISIQEQIDSLFLVADSSGGSIAKTLNSLASLDIMDTLMQSVNQDVKFNEKEITSCKEELEEIDTDLQRYKAMEPVISDGKALFEEYDSYVKLKQDKEHLNNLLYSLLNDASALNRISKFIKVWDDENLDESFSEYNILLQKRNRLEKLCSFIEKDSVPLKEIDSSKLEDICTEIKVYSETLEAKNTLQRNINSLKNNILLEKDISEKMNALQDELSKFDVCPLCGKSLGECND